MSKVPCGGFKLDENFFGMNENDELSLTGGSEGEGTPYQQLVTDGTGTARWEDRLAYVLPEEQVIFSQENIAFVERNGMYFSSGAIIPTTDINVGANYRVNFDGEAYNCVAYAPDAGRILIGNGLLFGLGVDTGEPFLISYSSASSEIVVGTLLTNPTHTVSVTGVVETVHKIPEKFLSKGFIVNIVGEESDGTGNTYLLFDKTDEEINNALNNGSTVKLNYYGLNIQYDSDPDMFWGVFPNQVGGNGIITQLAVVSVKKGANGWFPQETYITASTNSAS